MDTVVWNEIRDMKYKIGLLSREQGDKKPGLELASRKTLPVQMPGYNGFCPGCTAGGGGSTNSTAPPRSGTSSGS